MRLKRLLLSVVAAGLAALLCGCDLFTVDTDTLLAPARPSGDMLYISRAIDDSEKGDYTFKYPTAGDHRSAVILEDIDGDGKKEALAFYSTSGDEQTELHLNLIMGSGEDWKSASKASLVAGGVEEVAFSDLNQDGVKEIVVGWEIYGSSEKQLAVYEFSGGVLLQRMLERYSGFVCCDLDQNGTEEIFINNLNTGELSNRAALYTITEGGVSQVASCALDAAVKTVERPLVGMLSNGQPAIYLDGIKGIGAITEVLFLSKAKLVNPLLEGEISPENTRTLRAASILTEDINGDEILEIPVASDLASADSGNEKIYYTNWCSFNGERLTTRLVGIINTLDGYYITPPPSWVGNIAVSKDIDRHERTFYVYDNETATVGKMLVRFKAVSKDSYKKETYQNWVKLSETDTTVFIGMIGEGAAGTVGEAELKSMFKLY